MKSEIFPRDAARQMRPYLPPTEGRAGKLRLDFNENTVGCSPSVRQALARLTPEQLAAYPEQNVARQRVARRFGVRPEELLFTSGTDDALHLVARTFVEPRQAVLLVEPTFAMYRFYAELAGARVIALRYSADMRFPMASVLQALREKPRLFFLANPNNPTSTLVAPADLRRILMESPTTLVLVDEAYFDFARVTMLRYIRRYSNLIVTRTFSKAAGLAGLRIGCLFANRSLCSALRNAQSPYPVSKAALAAAEAVLQDGAFVRRYVQEVRASRAELLQRLVALGISYFPSTANFVLVDFGERAPAILTTLRQRGILLRDRATDFGRVGYVRITVGTRGQTRRLLRELRRLGW